MEGALLREEHAARSVRETPNRRHTLLIEPKVINDHDIQWDVTQIPTCQTCRDALTGDQSQCDVIDDETDLLAMKDHVVDVYDHCDEFTIRGSNRYPVLCEASIDGQHLGPRPRVTLDRTMGAKPDHLRLAIFMIEAISDITPTGRGRTQSRPAETAVVSHQSVGFISIRLSSVQLSVRMEGRPRRCPAPHRTQ